MTQYTVTLRLGAALADAVAVEWTSAAAPVESGRGWEPCLRVGEGIWRFSSVDPAAAEAPHRRDPGPFANLAIRYRREAAGPWSAASAPRKAIEIVPEEGDAPRLAAPVLLAPPVLLGEGRVGGELAVDPGRWGGAPAPGFAFRWRRDGAEIPGAVARARAVGPEDDGCALDCVVTATSLAGFAMAAAGPVRAAYAPPRLVGALPEEVLDAGGDPARVETAQAFAGEALTFSVAGARGETIDPATGTLTLPTAAPVDGATATVAAANSGGRVETTLRYTVEMAPELPFGPGAAVVLRSLWLPEGQTRTYGPELGFPGLPAGAAVEFTADPVGGDGGDPVWRAVWERPDAPGVWRLHDPRLAPEAPALFTAEDPRASRLRFRWRMAEAQDWSEESAPLTAPPPARPLAAALLPLPAEVQAAMEHPLRGYKVDVTFGGNGEGQAVQNAFSHCPAPLLALEAWSGETRLFGSVGGAFSGRRSGHARALEHLRHWLAGRAPAGRSGYQAQYEAQFVATAAILCAAPAVRGELTAQELRRIDLALKGCAIGSLWVVSDQNPYVTRALAGEQRTIRGYKAQRGGSINFSAPPRLIPYVVDGHLRREGSSLQAFLATFDRDAFAAEVAAAGGLGDLHDSYRQDWTLEVMRAAHPGMVEGFGPGPDKAMLHHVLRDGFPDRIWRGLGMTLDQGNAMFVDELERLFNRVVRPGPETYADGRPLPGRETGPGWTTAHGLKTPSPLAGIDETQLRGVLGSANPDGTTNKSAWAGLPNPLALGMMNELDTYDGGGGGNPAIRSCTTYTYHGAAAVANLTAAALVLGVLDGSDPRLAAPGGIADRMEVGVTDFLYRTTHGHREYSKGAHEHPNRDWNLAYIEGQGARFETWKGMWRMIMAWSRA